MTCPEPDCNCHLDLEADIRPLFTSKKGGKEYAALLDVAAVSCIEEKDRFYCPNQACSALYQFTNNRCGSIEDLRSQHPNNMLSLIMCASVMKGRRVSM